MRKPCRRGEKRICKSKIYNFAADNYTLIVKLTELSIKNFKSLADVTITPSDLTVIIGPNGSGKTNLANAFAFLKEVYANGLETAVQRSGGFDNIASAHSNRSKLIAIEFSTTFTSTFKVFYDQISFLSNIKGSSMKKSFLESSNDFDINVTHRFSIKSIGKSIESNYKITEEHFTVEGNGTNIVSFSRKNNEMSSTWIDEIVLPINNIVSLISNLGISIEKGPQELILLSFPLKHMAKDMQDSISRWAVYQLLPNTSKTAGVPTPNPTLSLYGENLPVLVEYMKKQQTTVWNSILSTMRKVIPTLIDINTGYLYNRTMGLFFREEGISRLWNAEEVSDGTILTLAMLCSVNDSRNTLVFIEEPENSLHPWILRELIQNFKNIAVNKTILVTTHSPTLIDMVSPSDIWCISKNGRKTQLNRLTDIAVELQTDWEEGRYKISDYVDSGLVPQAIPGGNL